MNLNQIQSLIAPVATPAAPAVVLASQLYAGSVQAGTNEILAGLGAVASGVGMEASGALAFSMVLLSMRRKAWGPMVFGIIGVVAYAVFAIIGISQAPKGSTFATFVLMSLVAFLASGLYSYMQDARKDDEQHLALVQAETRLTNAQARMAKASSGVQQASSASNGQMDTETGRKVKAWFLEHPGASLRDCAGELHISPETARRYKPQVGAK